MREQKSGRWSGAICGTVAGYGQHLYWQTPVCVCCRMVFREYNAAVQRRRYWERKARETTA